METTTRDAVILQRNDQLSLGGLIDRLEAVRPSPTNETVEVIFDFCNYFPADLSSWRGSYEELAIEPSDAPWGYESTPPTLEVFIEMCKEAVGKEYTGYKGGEYRMSRVTPVWVSPWGKSNETAVLDVIYDGYNVILITGYREY